MNLKDAFQTQNMFNKLSDHADNYLDDRDNVMTVKEKHFRSKVAPDQTDEELDVTNYDSKRFPAGDVIKFLFRLIEEREKLSHAIHAAKAKMSFDLDTAVDANRRRHALAATLDALVRQQSSKVIQKNAGRGYVFNKEGNQTEYRYDIERIQTIDYDRNKVRKLLKELYAEADKVSTEIDMALLNTQVNYELPFDIHGDYDSIIEDFIEKNAL